jgi:hypothetical protein
MQPTSAQDILEPMAALQRESGESADYRRTNKTELKVEKLK